MFQIHIIASVISNPIRVDPNDGRLYSKDNEYIPDDVKQQIEHNRHPSEEGEIISVRITSSVAVERGKGRPNVDNKPKIVNVNNANTAVTEGPHNVAASEKIVITEIPPDLVGANIEFIKQLHAKKDTKNVHNIDQIHPFQLNSKHVNNNTYDVSATKLSTLSEVGLNQEKDLDYDQNIPIARSIPFVAKELANYEHGFTKPPSERTIKDNSRLTTVSFNIVHDMPQTIHYNEPNQNHDNIYYNEQPQVYSEPAKVYSEPAKVYSEPAKVYSEPAKIYSEPAKVYSEPAKIYSEPAKFYSQPASLHLPNNDPHHWDTKPNPTPTAVTQTSTVEPKVEEKELIHHPEKNYEIDEKISVASNGKSHDVQQSTTTENSKVGYVVEGRQYRKYRVEERTPDGFIVGEYGVVRNEDGDLRGVRYTADGEASPSLIYDALMKFLQL